MVVVSRSTNFVENGCPDNMTYPFVPNVAFSWYLELEKKRNTMSHFKKLFKTYWSNKKLIDCEMFHQHARIHTEKSSKQNNALYYNIDK